MSDIRGPVPIGAFTTPNMAFQALAKIFGRTNIFGKKTVFKGQIVGPLTPLNSTQAVAAGAATNTSDSVVKYVAPVRLVEHNMPHVSYIPNPCDITVANNKALITHLLSLHMRVTIPVASGAVIPQENDIIDVILQPGDNNMPFDVQFGKYGKLRDRPRPGTLTTTGALTCADFEALFDALGTGTVGGGPSQKGVYIGGGNNIPIVNGGLAAAGLISATTQGCRNPRILTDVVSDWDAMAAAFAAHFSAKGWKLGGSGDRTYETQVKLREEWCAKGECGKASKPGYSNHGWGLAVDTFYCDSSGEKKSLSFKGEAYKWLFDNAATYNWEHPYWAQKPSVSEELGRPCVAPPNKKCGSNIEVWHWESSRDSSLIRKGTAAYEEAVAAHEASSSPAAAPIEAGDGDESSSATAESTPATTEEGA